ncbi:MAG TPA: hypothetical protein C5S37_12780 [Methanophagales archaeon]|nr:hypothetical protein [Methanophagales archaeon]
MSAGVTTQIKISKGQITIPESLREQYELHDGEPIVLIPVENGIMVKRRCDMKSLRGSIQGDRCRKSIKVHQKTKVGMKD